MREGKFYADVKLHLILSCSVYERVFFLKLQLGNYNCFLRLVVNENV